MHWVCSEWHRRKAVGFGCPGDLDLFPTRDSGSGSPSPPAIPGAANMLEKTASGTSLQMQRSKARQGVAEVRCCRRCFLVQECGVGWRTGGCIGIAAVCRAPERLLSRADKTGQGPQPSNHPLPAPPDHTDGLPPHKLLAPPGGPHPSIRWATPFALVAGALDEVGEGTMLI
jgi:hypothetical protein